MVPIIIGLTCFFFRCRRWEEPQNKRNSRSTPEESFTCGLSLSLLQVGPEEFIRLSSIPNYSVVTGMPNKPRK